MAQSQSPKALEEALVIDGDVHLTIPPSEAAAYLDEPYKSFIENPTYTPVPFDGWNREMGGKIQSDRVESPADIEDTLCRDFHVDHPIINGLPMLARIQQTDLANALMRGFNDLLLDRFLDENEDFFGLISLAPQDPLAAAEEIDRMGDENQVVGILLDTVGANPPIGDERYDVIYRAAADNNLQVAYHGSVNGGAIEFPRQNQGFEQFLEAHTLFHSWGAMMTLTSLLVNGVPEKFPDLNFTILESGVSWVPYTMWRLNKEYSIRRSEAPLLQKSPEKYVRDQFYFGTQPIGEPDDPKMIQKMIELVGTDSIIFATDYPHWDFDHPDGVDQHLRKTFSEEDRDKLLHKNAIEAFGLDI